MSYQFDVDLTADERVAAFVVRDFVEKGRVGESEAHLRACPDVSVAHVEGSDGEYGCDTGCEYARLEASLSCPHGFSVDHEYGAFGDLADILEEIAR